MKIITFKIMTTLTGLIDTDREVFKYLNIADLLAISQTNYHLNNICLDDIFWRNIIKRDFSIIISQHKPDSITYKDQYKYLYTYTIDKAIEDHRVDALINACMEGKNIVNDKFYKHLTSDEIIEIFKYIKVSTDLRGSIKYSHIRVLKQYIGNAIPKVNEANIAASAGNVDIIEWFFKEYNILPNIRGVNDAVSNGHLKMLILLKTYNILPTTDTIHHAVFNNYLDTVKWMGNNNMYPINADHATVHGDIKMIKWLIENNVNLTKIGIKSLIKRGHIRVIKWLTENHKLNPNEFINIAAGYGHINFLEWYKIRNIYPDREGANIAAEHGHVKSLDWIAEHTGYYPNEFGIINAAKNSHLDVLVWSFKNKIFPGISSANIAAKYGNINVIKLLYKYNILPNQQGIDSAAENGHFNILEWASMYNKFPTLDCLNNLNNSELIDWLDDKGIFM